MQLSRAIFKMKWFWLRFSSLMRVVTPFILRKFSLNCLFSSKSLMMLMSFGLFVGYSLSKAKMSLPTYQTSSNTLLIPFDMSYLVISKITRVASGLFMARRSIILLNISLVINFAFISIYLRCKANISIRTGGVLLTSAII